MLHACPGKLQGGHLLIGGLEFGRDCPGLLRIFIGLLNDRPASNALEVERRCRSRKRSFQKADILAPPATVLEDGKRLFGEPGANNDFQEVTFGRHRFGRELVNDAVECCDSPKSRDRIGSSCYLVTLAEIGSRRRSTRVPVLDDRTRGGRQVGNQLPSTIRIAQVVVAKLFAP